MRYKLIFSVLMMNSFLVQTAGAGMSVEEFVEKFPANAPKIPANFSFGVKFFGKTASNGGAVELVENGGVSVGSEIKKGMKQIVTHGGNSFWPRITGGAQFVYEEDGASSAFKEDSFRRKSASSSAIIHGNGGVSGQQNIYNGGESWDTRIGPGGVQNVFGTGEHLGGTASNTVVYEGGRQNIWGGGRANTVTLGNGSKQVIYLGGSAENLTIESGGSSWVQSSTKLGGTTKINEGGHLYLFTGGNGGHLTKGEVALENGWSNEEVFSVNDSSSRVNIDNLNGDGGTISFSSVGPDGRFSELHIDNLSGSSHFNFRVNAGEGRGDYLFVKKGAGNHTVSVVDTGIEATNSFSQVSGSPFGIDLITDRSGGANFTLEGSSAGSIRAVDRGAYMYNLSQRSGGKGSEKIWYLSAAGNRTGRLRDLSRISVSRPPFPDDVMTRLSGGGRESGGHSSDISFLVVSPGGRDDKKNRGRSSRHVTRGLESTDFSSSSSTLSSSLMTKKLYDSMTLNQEVSKGRSLITTLFSRGTKVGDGGVEVVEHGGYSTSATINTGGKQIVKDGGSASGTKIEGGEQFIHGERGFFSSFEEGNFRKYSGSYGDFVSGTESTKGKQNVYDSGVAWGAHIGRGGVQNVFGRHGRPGGAASNTTVYDGGQQNIFEGGKAEGVIVKEGGKQAVYSGGFTKELTIGNGGHSWIFSGAKLGGGIKVDTGGGLHLFTGDNTPYSTKEEIPLSGRVNEEVFFSGANNSWFDIEKLSGGGTVNFESVGYDERFSTLYVGDLSGSLHFNFRINYGGHRSDYLIVKNGSGNHTINVIDTGIEVADSVSLKHSLVSELNLIFDRSGGANFTLKNPLGGEISTIDSGAYMYILRSRTKISHKRKRDTENEGKIWYLVAATGAQGTHQSGESFSQRRVKKGPQVSASSSSLPGGSSLISFSDEGQKQSRRRPPRHVNDQPRVSVPSRHKPGPHLPPGGLSPISFDGREDNGWKQKPDQPSRRKDKPRVSVPSRHKPGPHLPPGGLSPISFDGREDNGWKQKPDQPSRRKDKPRVSVPSRHKPGPHLPPGGLSPISFDGREDNGWKQKPDQPSRRKDKPRVSVPSRHKPGPHLPPGGLSPISFDGKEDNGWKQGQRRSRRHVVEDTQIADLSAVSPSILERRANGADVFESGLKRPEVSASSALMSDDKDDAVMVAFDSKLMSDDATVVFGDETLDLSDDKNDAAMVASDPELMSDDATVAMFGDGTLDLSDDKNDAVMVVSDDANSGETEHQVRSARNVNQRLRVPASSSVSRPEHEAVQVISPEGWNPSLGKPRVSLLLTAPSTDAVLSMAAATGLIFHNEVQSLRSGRGILDKNKKGTALWTSMIKSKEQIAAGHAHFKLEQTGVILGLGHLREFVSGEVYIGGFGSYDQARIVHARDGVSDVSTYGVGAYATYFDHNGWYLDSVVKYNYYQNDLKAISTNKLPIKGAYNQWAVGASFETGYRLYAGKDTWMQPYGQLTWSHVEGQTLKLSNGMIGEIAPSASLRSEVGLSVGHELTFGVDTSLTAYATVSWLREYIDNNHTVINKVHKFTTDLSRDVGKLGVGLSGFLHDKLTFYAEAHYMKGYKTEQSLQGILGIRYNF